MCVCCVCMDHERVSLREGVFYFERMCNMEGVLNMCRHFIHVWQQ